MPSKKAASNVGSKKKGRRPRAGPDEQASHGRGGAGRPLQDRGQGPAAKRPRGRGRGGSPSPSTAHAVTPLTSHAVMLEKVEDLEKLSVAQLKEFLRPRGVRLGGNQAELLQLARLYFSYPTLKPSSSLPIDERGASEINDQDSPFNDPSLTWQMVTKELKIPSQFSIEKITDYLRNNEVSLLCFPSAGNDSDEDDVQAGTQKPVVKGRKMYLSERLTHAEFAETGSHLYIRGNCEASMRKAVRYPGVALIASSGTVAFGECTCEAKEDGRCCHVACLLYLAEDVSLKQEPKIP